MREEELFGDEGGMDEAAELGLTRAMRRVDAPLGFADRVLLATAAAAETDAAGRVDVDEPACGKSMDGRVGNGFGNSGARTGKVVAWPRLQFERHGSSILGRTTGIAAALLLVLLAPVGGYLHERARQAEAESAARQFALAMRLTQEALVDAGEHLAAHRHSLDR